MDTRTPGRMPFLVVSPHLGGGLALSRPTPAAVLHATASPRRRPTARCMPGVPRGGDRGSASGVAARQPPRQRGQARPQECHGATPIPHCHPRRDHCPTAPPLERECAASGPATSGIGGRAAAAVLPQAPSRRRRRRSKGCNPAEEVTRGWQVFLPSLLPPSRSPVATPLRTRVLSARRHPTHAASPPRGVPPPSPARSPPPHLTMTLPLLLRQGGNATTTPTGPLPARPRSAGTVLLSILPPVVLVGTAVATALVVRARRGRRAVHAGGGRGKGGTASDAAAAVADGRLRWRDGPPREDSDAARLEAFAAAAAAAAAAATANDRDGREGPGRDGEAGGGWASQRGGGGTPPMPVGGWWAGPPQPTGRQGGAPPQPAG